MTPCQEVTYAIIYVLVYCPVGHQSSPIAEVVGPPRQEPIDLIPHLRPLSQVARTEYVPNPPLDPSHTLFRGRCSHIQIPILTEVMGTKRVSQKVKMLSASISDTRLALVQGESQADHHLPRPFKCLPGLAATQNNKVVRIGYNPGFVSVIALPYAPILEKAVHVHIGKQRAYDPALGRAAPCLLAACDVPLAVIAGLYHGNRQPHLDQAQDVPIHNSPGDAFHQVPMGDGLEVVGQIGIDDLGKALKQHLVNLPYGILGAAPGTIPVSIGLQIRLEDWFGYKLAGCLDNPISDRWDTQWPSAPARLRDVNPENGLGFVRLCTQFLPDAREPLLQSVRLDISKGLSIQPRCAAVGPRHAESMIKDVLPIYLVVQKVEAKPRLRLRLEIQLSLEVPDLIWCFQAQCQSPHLTSVESTPEARPLPSILFPGNLWYYEPLRLPPGPTTQCRPLGLRPPPRTGLPRCPRCHTNVPPPLPRWIRQVRASVSSLPVKAFPVLQAGRHPQLHFRGLLRVHSRCGPLARSPTHGGFCLRASAFKVTLACRLTANESNRKLPMWNFHPLASRALVAHCKIQVLILIRNSLFLGVCEELQIRKYTYYRRSVEKLTLYPAVCCEESLFCDFLHVFLHHFLKLKKHKPIDLFRRLKTAALLNFKYILRFR